MNHYTLFPLHPPSMNLEPRPGAVTSHVFNVQNMVIVVLLLCVCICSLLVLNTIITQQQRKRKTINIINTNKQNNN